MGGDGGTYDIGLQSLSGAMERGHDLTYICYDNGAYMNTGVQRSSATPPGAATTTTPVGRESYGRKGNRKDLTKIMLAHNLGYVAQASIHDIGDLFRKMKKAIDHDGPSFINLLSPCIPGWKIDADMAVESARLGVDCNFWPLFEVEQGRFTINYRPSVVKPVSEWVLSQGRFKHLKKHPEVIAAFQAEIDKQWAWLEMEEARTK
jgi:pyruvate ferredoxin oxidoreductase beta subunit